MDHEKIIEFYDLRDAVAFVAATEMSQGVIRFCCPTAVKKCESASCLVLSIRLVEDQSQDNVPSLELAVEWARVIFRLVRHLILIHSEEYGV